MRESMFKDDVSWLYVLRRTRKKVFLCVSVKEEQFEKNLYQSIKALQIKMIKLSEENSVSSAP